MTLTSKSGSTDIALHTLLTLKAARDAGVQKTAHGIRKHRAAVF